MTTREKLYEEVWAEPMTTVAKRYGVSSNYLARVCERMSVPCPPRGYWAKKSAGAKVEQPPLSEPVFGCELEWKRNGGLPRRHVTTPRTSVVKPPVDRERPTKHRLLIGAQEQFDHAREIRDDQYVRPHKRNIVDIFVSKELLARALEVASELFLALEDRGQQVALGTGTHYLHVEVHVREGQKPKEHDYYSHYSTGRWSPGVPTITLVGEVAIGLTLFEISEEVDTRYDDKLHKRVRATQATDSDAKLLKRMGLQEPRLSKHWLPSRRFGLHAYAPYSNIEWDQYWYEPTVGAMAGMFEAIGKELERAAPKLVRLIEAEEVRKQEAARRWEIEQVEWRKRQAEEDRKREEQRKREAEVKRESTFRESIALWTLARDIRAYVAEAKALVSDAKLQVTKGGHRDEELRWAIAYADRIDPLTPWRADVEAVRQQMCPICKNHDKTDACQPLVFGPGHEPI